MAVHRLHHTYLQSHESIVGLPLSSEEFVQRWYKWHDAAPHPFEVEQEGELFKRLNPSACSGA